MCRGIPEGNSGGNSCPKQGTPSSPSRSSVRCELCNSTASLYCQADDAFLCRKCDTWVHQANFLALRHIRCFLCNTCQNLTQRYLIGASTEVVLPTIVSLASESRGSRCDSDVERNCSPTLKTPFLFL
ncbi:hypothetical protein SLA2020_315090 [Shorea laevis]